MVGLDLDFASNSRETKPIAGVTHLAPKSVRLANIGTKPDTPDLLSGMLKRWKTCVLSTAWKQRGYQSSARSPANDVHAPKLGIRTKLAEDQHQTFHEKPRQEKIELLSRGSHNLMLRWMCMSGVDVRTTWWIVPVPNWHARVKQYRLTWHQVTWQCVTSATGGSTINQYSNHCSEVWYEIQIGI